MKSHIARLTLIMLIGVAVVLTMRFVDSRANTQQPDRIVARRPWPNEPVKVVGVKTKKMTNVEIGKAFADNDEWVEGFTITVVNNYHKTVTSLTVDMVFRRELGDIRPPLARSLHLGPSPITPEYKDRDPTKVVQPDKSIELSLSPDDYKTVKADLIETGYSKVNRIDGVIREVGFEDGSILYSGTFYVQDPAHPNDPTKKIKVPQPPAAQNHKMEYPQIRNDNVPGFSFVKTSFASFAVPRIKMAPDPD
jgi:hypothetical protein